MFRKRGMVWRETFSLVKKLTMIFSTECLPYVSAQATMGWRLGSPQSKWHVYISISYAIKKLILNQKNTFSFKKIS